MNKKLLILIILLCITFVTIILIASAFLFLSPFIIKNNNNLNFINSYIGGNNSPLLNNTWTKETYINNKLNSTETLIFDDNYTCNYTKIYKERTFTIGNKTYPTINQDKKCYYKIELNENSSYILTIYDIDLDNKSAEKILKLFYYYDGKSIVLADEDDFFTEPYFIPTKTVNKNILTDNKTVNTIKTISYSEYQTLLNNKDSFVLIAVNDYEYSKNYKEALPNIIDNYSTKFYYYEYFYENNKENNLLKNISGFPTTLIIKNGSIVSKIEGFDKNETINTLKNELKKLDLN